MTWLKNFLIRVFIQKQAKKMKTNKVYSKNQKQARFIQKQR